MLPFQFSPEDLGLEDENGNKVFSNLAKLRKSSKVSYLPYVQNPIRALKHLDASVSEISADSINDKFILPDSEILIVNLDDATDSENRINMLKRHGENCLYFILSIVYNLGRLYILQCILFKLY